MRKGRARRRSKVSRPSIPVESRAKREPSAELQAVSGPRIVSGVAQPSDAPPSGETTAPESLETLARGEAEVPTARSAEVPTVESVEPDPVEAAEAAEAAAVVLAAATEPELAASADDADPTVRDALPAAVAAAGEAAEDEAPGSDEISIPPVGDLVVEEFFSEGDVGKHLRAEAEIEEAVLDAKIARKHAPEVVQRRTRLARYVRWAVAGAGALCLAALARGAVAPHAPPVANATSAMMVAANEEPIAKEAAKPEPSKAEAPAPSAEPAKAEAPAAEAKPEAAKADAPAAEAPTPDPKAALTEKNKARAALEGGRLAAAIEAGERSVALDPSDGEAWLLLGAAYQEKGANADARRCYAACVKQGKRGPIGECNAMLR